MRKDGQSDFNRGFGGKAISYHCDYCCYNEGYVCSPYVGSAIFSWLLITRYEHTAFFCAYVNCGKRLLAWCLSVCLSACSKSAGIGRFCVCEALYWGILKPYKLTDALHEDVRKFTFCWLIFRLRRSSGEVAEKNLNTFYVKCIFPKALPFKI
jgi:hypothetical protein